MYNKLRLFQEYILISFDDGCETAITKKNSKTFPLPPKHPSYLFAIWTSLHTPNSYRRKPVQHPFNYSLKKGSMG